MNDSESWRIFQEQQQPDVPKVYYTPEDARRLIDRARRAESASAVRAMAISVAIAGGATILALPFLPHFTSAVLAVVTLTTMFDFVALLVMHRIKHGTWSIRNAA